jgi:lysylphosphatidylglycerol synthetase-like protein (DUF2156 family)
MIILIDAIGVLSIIALGHQGCKEALGIRKSFLLPSLCSVLIFYKIFPLIHELISSAITSRILAGVLTIALVNFILVTFFYKLFVYFLNKFEEKFFLPEFPLHLRQIIGVLLGILTGYVFIAGVIESLDQSLARNTVKKHSVLANSVFYQISHKKEVNSQVHKHLSTIFIVVGIVSFTLGAIVNYYTIRRLNGQK